MVVVVTDESNEANPDNIPDLTPATYNTFKIGLGYESRH